MPSKGIEEERPTRGITKPALANRESTQRATNYSCTTPTHSGRHAPRWWESSHVVRELPEHGVSPEKLVNSHGIVERKSAVVGPDVHDVRMDLLSGKGEIEKGRHGIEEHWSRGEGERAWKGGCGLMHYEDIYS